MNWDYIAGFFDGEGCLRKNDQCPTHNSYYISIAQKQREVLDVIKEFFDEYNMSSWISGMRQASGVHYIAIKGYRSVKIFLENIKDKVIVKKKQVDEALNNPKWEKFHTDFGKIEKDQIKILHEYGFTQRQICRALERRFSNLTHYFRRHLPNYNYKKEKGVMLCR